MAANDASGPKLSKKPRLLIRTTTTSGGQLENNHLKRDSAEKWSNMDAADQTLERDFKEILKGSHMELLQAFSARLNICTNLRKELVVASKARKEAEDLLRAEREARQKERSVAFSAHLNICTNLRKELVVASKARKEAEDLLRAEREARQKEREGFLELISFLEKELVKIPEEKVALEQSEQSLREALHSQEKALVDLRSSIGTIQKGAVRAYSSFNRLHGKLRELCVATNIREVPAPRNNISLSLDADFVDGGESKDARDADKAVDKAVLRQHKWDGNDRDDDEDTIPISARMIRPRKKA